MSFTKDYQDLYIELWNDESDGEGIIFDRNSGMELIKEDDDTYCFGEVILTGRFKGVYWDIDYGKHEAFIDMIKKSCKGNELPHFWFRNADKIPLKIDI